MTDNLDSTLVTCISGLSNYHVRHYSDSDHAVQYCWPRDRVRARADSGISAVIQWFDNKSLSWRTWFNHFQAVADLQDGMISIRCDICRVVYMSLWSSGQRELERREVLVLPPRGRVGWSVSLVWAFGESTR